MNTNTKTLLWILFFVAYGLALHYKGYTEGVDSCGDSSSADVQQLIADLRAGD